MSPQITPGIVNLPGPRTPKDRLIVLTEPAQHVLIPVVIDYRRSIRNKLTMTNGFIAASFFCSRSRLPTFATTLCGDDTYREIFLHFSSSISQRSVEHAFIVPRWCAELLFILSYCFARFPPSSSSNRIIMQSGKTINYSVQFHQSSIDWQGGNETMKLGHTHTNARAHTHTQ